VRQGKKREEKRNNLFFFGIKGIMNVKGTAKKKYSRERLDNTFYCFKEEEKQKSKINSGSARN
jgi:hypothetical protein